MNPFGGYTNSDPTLASACGLGIDVPSWYLIGLVAGFLLGLGTAEVLRRWWVAWRYEEIKP